MSIADQLQKLEELYNRGMLTPDEFAKAKEALFAGRSTTTDFGQGLLSHSDLAFPDPAISARSSGTGLPPLPRRGGSAGLWLALLTLLAVGGLAAFAWTRWQALQGELDELRAQLKKLSDGAADKAPGAGAAVEDLKTRLADLGKRTDALQTPLTGLLKATEALQLPAAGDLLAVGPSGQPARMKLQLGGKPGVGGLVLQSDKGTVGLRLEAGGNGGSLRMFGPKRESLVSLERGPAAGNGVLRLHGPKGQPLLQFSAIPGKGPILGCGDIMLYNTGGRRLLAVNSSSGVGALFTYRPNGKRAVALSTTPAGGALVTFSESSDRPLMELTTDRHANGLMNVWTAESQKLVTVGAHYRDLSKGAPLQGGAVTVHGLRKGGPLAGRLGVDANGNGSLETFRNDGKALVRLGIQDNAGAVFVANAKGVQTRLQPGKDVAEVVRVAPGATVAPGDVVSLAGFDGQGALVRRSASAYDTAVLGVVSGAGGLRPGVVLNSNGAQGERAVALAGTVYCRADAAAGPIRPGDLLVASGTAGHVMRADPARVRPGTLVGRALAPLARGRGLIPVWVTAR
jgi:hypothetical protein